MQSRKPYPAPGILLTSGDSFLGPLEWARAETGGPDKWLLKRREFPGVDRVTHQGKPRILGIPTISFLLRTLLSNKPFVVTSKKKKDRCGVALSPDLAQCPALKL